MAREQSPDLGATVEIVTKLINFIKTRPLKSKAGPVLGTAGPN